MAYFAQLDDNNIVLTVLSVSNDEAPDPAPNDQAGEQYLHSIGFTGRWIQTSYNNNFRGHYAGIGHRYDEELNLFVAPQPFPSWTMADDGWWMPPAPYPTDGSIYRWDEPTTNWKRVD